MNCIYPVNRANPPVPIIIKFPNPASDNSAIWAFDLRKGSIGKVVREGNK